MWSSQGTPFSTPFGILPWQIIWEDLGRPESLTMAPPPAHTETGSGRGPPGIHTALCSYYRAVHTLVFSTPHLKSERNALQRAQLLCLKPVTEDGKTGEWQSQKQKPPWLCQERAPAANCNSVCVDSLCSRLGPASSTASARDSFPI